MPRTPIFLQSSRPPASWCPQGTWCLYFAKPQHTNGCKICCCAVCTNSAVRLSYLNTGPAWIGASWEGCCSALHRVCRIGMPWMGRQSCPCSALSPRTAELHLQVPGEAVHSCAVISWRGTGVGFRVCETMNYWRALRSFCVPFTQINEQRSVFGFAVLCLVKQHNSIRCVLERAHSNCSKEQKGDSDPVCSTGPAQWVDGFFPVFTLEIFRCYKSRRWHDGSPGPPSRVDAYPHLLLLWNLTALLFFKHVLR
jgi:hypothetical protein